MIRALVLLAVLAGLAYAAIFAADHPGDVIVNWQGLRLQAGLVTILLGVLGIIFVIWVLARIWSWLKGGTPLSPERRALRRSRAGLKEVDGALVALAAGDPRKALTLGQAAIKHLDGSAIAYVVSAQAATASGKPELAQSYFEALSETEKGKFLGLRGQASEARRAGHISKALDLSEAALIEAPRSDWAIATAFELEAKLGKWDAALDTLKKATAKSIFDSETSTRHLAAIRYGQAMKSENEDRPADAVRQAKQSLGVRPGFAPAAVLAARLYKKSGKVGAAQKVLESAWKTQPHPAVAESYAALMPMETAEARYTRFEKLAKLAPKHPESQMRLAEAALGAGKLDAAQDALADSLTGLGRARAGFIMGQVAAARGDAPQERKKWAELASRGAPEPLYQCSVCRSQNHFWTSHCPTCDSFNTLEWDARPNPTSYIGPREDALHLVGGVAHLPAPDVADETPLREAPIPEADKDDKSLDASKQA